MSASDGQGQATASVTVQASELVLEPGNDAPIVRLSADPTSGTYPLAVTFTARGSDPNGDSLEYIWDFGDDTVASGAATLSHTYEEAGFYRVQVIATDGRGGIDRDEVYVDVSPPPATLNLDVTPDNADWNVYNSEWQDEYYSVGEYGSGDETLQLPADYYYIYVTADGYESAFGDVYLDAGSTENISITLTPEEGDPSDPVDPGPGDPIDPPPSDPGI